MHEGRAVYVCECACGQRATVRATDLVMQKIRKCSRGCAYEPPRVRVTFNTIDGQSRCHRDKGRVR